MSSVGGFGANPLVTPAAGLSGSQRVASTNTAHAEAAERKFQLDRDRQTEQTVEDVGPSDETTDRDADGRMTGSAHDNHPPPLEPPSTPPIDSSTRRSHDVDQQLGNHLDLDA